jgi:hypothetical protein
MLMIIKVVELFAKKKVYRVHNGEQAHVPFQLPCRLFSIHDNPHDSHLDAAHEARTHRRPVLVWEHF